MPQLTKKEMKQANKEINKHRCKFQFMSVRRTSNLPLKREATFICMCGKLKRVEIKEK